MSNDNVDMSENSDDTIELPEIQDDVEMKRDENARLIWNECLEAIQEGNIERVMELLNHSEVDVNLQDYSGSSLLLQAVESGHIEIVQFLLVKGTKVDYRDKNGKTALFGAAKEGHVDIVQLLLEKGAALNHRDSNGFAAMQLAVNNNHNEVMRVLIEAGAQVDNHDNHATIDSPLQSVRIEHKSLPTDNSLSEWFIHPSKVEYDGNK